MKTCWCRINKIQVTFFFFLTFSVKYDIIGKDTSCHYSSWTLPILTVRDITHTSAAGCAGHSYSRYYTNSSSHPLTIGKTPTFPAGHTECVNLFQKYQEGEKKTKPSFPVSSGCTLQHRRQRGAAPLRRSEVIQLLSR